MNPSAQSKAVLRRAKRLLGFTLIEILVVVAVVAILGALAMPAYDRYVAKARAAELVLNYDAVRTKVSIPVKSNSVTEQCAALSAMVNPANLQSDYAAIDVAFEPVTGGFTPVMRFCSVVGQHGTKGVDVARETHQLLSRSAAIGQGAVIGEAAVSFVVQLVNGAVACKVATAAKSLCTGASATTATSTLPPQQPNSAAVAAASAPPPALAVTKLAPMAESVKTDFSQPPITGVWMSQDPSVWGWKTDNPDGKVEYGKGEAYGDRSGGNIGVIELEGYAGTPSNLYREINARPGAKYEFSFDLSGRVGLTSDSAGVQVIWEGKVIDTIYPPADAFGFVRHTYNMVATGTSSRIELRAVTQDGSGPVVDNLGMAFKGLTAVSP